jgi:hypothetical protein
MKPTRQPAQSPADTQPQALTGLKIIGSKCVPSGAPTRVRLKEPGRKMNDAMKIAPVRPSVVVKSWILRT